jgi:hypothetical protein
MPPRILFFAVALLTLFALVPFAVIACYKQLQTGVREKEKVETKSESDTKSRQ